MKIDLSFQFETLDEMRQVFHCLLQDFKIEAPDQDPPEPEKELFHRQGKIRASKIITDQDIQAWIDSQADKFHSVEVALTESKKPVKLYDFVGVQSIVCPGCNKPFIKKRKDQIFCSKACNKSYKAPAQTIVCPTCNNPFEQKNKSMVFCSNACRPSSIKQSKITDAICPVCGNKFDKKLKIKYCSKKCSTKAKNQKYNAKQALKKQAAVSVTDPSPVDHASVPVHIPAQVTDLATSTVAVALVSEKHYDPELLKQKLDKIKKDIPIKRERPAVEHYF
jgi:ribosomal protein L37AE/L43A